MNPTSNGSPFESQLPPPQPNIEQPVNNVANNPGYNGVPEQPMYAAEQAPIPGQPMQSMPLPPMPMPQQPIQPTVPGLPQPTAVNPTTTFSASNLLEDNDLIEKEWVNKAKKIVDDNRDDPFKQSEELTGVKVDYMKTHYDKNIKLK